METYWSFKASASRSASLRMPSSLGESCVAAPRVWGSEPRARCASCARVPTVTPILPSAAGTTPPSWASMAARRCSGVTSGWSFFSASVCAVARTSWALTVNWSMRMESLRTQFKLTPFWRKIASDAQARAVVLVVVA